MRIAVDAMGGDHAPLEIIKGCAAALARNPELEIILVGKQDAMEQALEGISRERMTLMHAPTVIETGEPPMQAIKKKKDSSLLTAIDLVRDQKADAVVSAGSTGAVMAGALFHLGRIKGIKRPALAPTLPTKTGSMLFLDSGANADCQEEYLVQFAEMGSAYMKEVCHVEKPRVALCNIGAEEDKGSMFIKNVHVLLKQDENIHFVGNLEPREALFGGADVLVSDGFSGNMVIKSMEGCAAFMTDMMKKEFSSSLRFKLGAALLYPALKRVKKSMDYTEYGGAVLLGVNGCVIKAHGVSKEKAFSKALEQAMGCVNGNVVGKITAALESGKGDEV